MAKQAPMRVREFARYCDRSDTAVKKAIEAGKIPAECLGSIYWGDRKVPAIVDAEKAKAAWFSNTQQHQVRDHVEHGEAMKAHHARRREADGKSPAAKKTSKAKAKTATLQQLAERDSVQAEQEQAAEEQRNVDPFPHLPTVAQSSREREMYRARRERIAFEEAEGKLVNAEQIRLAMVEMITKAKTSLMGVPSKAKSRIPSLTVEHIEILEGLIEATLKELSYAPPSKSRRAADTVDL